jgi:hypothetical protein
MRTRDDVVAHELIACPWGFAADAAVGGVGDDRSRELVIGTAARACLERVQ